MKSLIRRELEKAVENQSYIGIIRKGVQVVDMAGIITRLTTNEIVMEDQGQVTVFKLSEIAGVVITMAK